MLIPANFGRNPIAEDASAGSDAREEAGLPLKRMALGDCTPQPDARSVAHPAPVSVDKDNGNAAMQGQDLRLQRDVSGTRAEEPDVIVCQMPELAQLIELRNALKALKEPLSTIPDFRRTVQEIVADGKARAALLKELGLEA